MEKLTTIQKREKLNVIFPVDEKGNGGAHHCYEIMKVVKDEPDTIYASIQFQNGPRNEEGSIHGILDTNLLEIVRHRLQCFQAGLYATRENAIALTHIEEALLWLNKRAFL